MRRVLSVLLTLSLVAGFVTPRLQALPDGPSGAPTTEVLAPSDVEGRGVLGFIGCVGCAAAGLVIATNGVTTAIAAMAMEGSALALASCVALCYESIR
jgi:hypothetical protein